MSDVSPFVQCGACDLGNCTIHGVVATFDMRDLCPHGRGKAVYCEACVQMSVKVERDRYKAALEEIARRLCKFPVGDKCEEPDCRVELFEGDLSDLCSTCVARAALEASDV